MISITSRSFRLSLFLFLASTGTVFIGFDQFPATVDAQQAGKDKKDKDKSPSGERGSIVEDRSSTSFVEAGDTQGSKRVNTPKPWRSGNR